MSKPNKYLDQPNEELIALFQNGSIDTKQFFKTFIKSNSGLISNVVNNFFSQIYSNPKYCSIDKKDIESEAHLAIIKALDNYDKTKSKFTTHATNMMKWTINNFLSRKVNKNYISEKDRDNIEKFEHEVISLNSSYEENFTFEDIIADKRIDLEEEVETNCTKSEMLENMNLLKPNEKEILEKLFGINCTEVSGEVLAKELGLTRAGVKYHKDRALDKIRKKMNYFNKTTLRR